MYRVKILVFRAFRPLFICYMTWKLRTNAQTNVQIKNYRYHSLYVKSPFVRSQKFDCFLLLNRAYDIYLSFSMQFPSKCQKEENFGKTNRACHKCV